MGALIPQEVVVMKKMNPFAGRNKGLSWFWWGINIGVFLALVVWWWLKNQSDEGEKPTLKYGTLNKPVKEPEGQITIDQKVSDEAPAEPDDLKIIEGIGPKSAQVLGDAGIHTFSALAALSPDEIHGVVKSAHLPVPYPETWSEQAALAAKGKWDELLELKRKLMGGRKV
jgi:predicted flap endonuclease-1-like 5' DNA nuclease